MRRCAIAILLGLAAGCATPPGPAPVPPASSPAVEIPAWEPGRALRLDEAIELSLQHDPRLTTLRAAVEMARIASRASTAPANPEFRGSYQQNGSEDDLTGATEDTEEMGVALRLFPQRPWETRAKSIEGDAGLQVALAGLHGAEFIVRQDVRLKFAELAHRDRDIESLQRVVEGRQARYDALKTAAGEGQATAVDVLGAGLDYSDALVRLGESESARRRASRALSTMIGAGPTTELKVRATDLKRKSRVADFDPAYLEQYALEHRMDLRAAEWQTRMAWAGWKKALAERIPWFSYIQAGYGEEVGGNSESWSAQFGIELPIFTDPGSGHQVMAAALAQARAFEAEVRADVADDVTDAIELLKEVDEEFRRFERDMAPLMKELESSLKTAREAQSLSVDTAAQIEVRLAEAERARLQADDRREQALIALEAALGSELPQLMETETVVEALPAQ